MSEVTPAELFSLADGLERVSRMYEAFSPRHMEWCAERLRREAEVLAQEVC